MMAELHLPSPFSPFTIPDDGMGYRLREATVAGGATTTKNLVSILGNRVIQERDGSDTVTARYYWDGGIFFKKDHSTSAKYFVPEFRNSPFTGWNNAGTFNRYDLWDSFGVLEDQSASGSLSPFQGHSDMLLDSSHLFIRGNSSFPYPELGSDARGSFTLAYINCFAQVSGNQGAAGQAWYMDVCQLRLTGDVLHQRSGAKATYYGVQWYDKASNKWLNAYLGSYTSDVGKYAIEHRAQCGCKDAPPKDPRLDDSCYDQAGNLKDVFKHAVEDLDKACGTVSSCAALNSAIRSCMLAQCKKKDCPVPGKKAVNKKVYCDSPKSKMCQNDPTLKAFMNTDHCSITLCPGYDTPLPGCIHDPGAGRIFHEIIHSTECNSACADIRRRKQERMRGKCKTEFCAVACQYDCTKCRSQHYDELFIKLGCIYVRGDCR